MPEGIRAPWSSCIYSGAGGERHLCTEGGPNGAIRPSEPKVFAAQVETPAPESTANEVTLCQIGDLYTGYKQKDMYNQ